MGHLSDRDLSIMPIDAVKTTLQVEGAGGLKLIGDPGLEEIRRSFAGTR